MSTSLRWTHLPLVFGLLLAGCGDDGEGGSSGSSSGGSSGTGGGGQAGSGAGTGDSEAVCDDGLDDDADGATDCADSDCAISSACSSEPGAHVATIELDAPRRSPFTLRATVPVPPGVFPRSDGKAPFGIVDTTGTTWPAQVQTVSRHPNGDADVVEVLARVEYGAAVKPGDRMRYEVRNLDHDQPAWPSNVSVPELLQSGPVPLPSEVKALAAPGSLKVRARDVFGHRYERDLMLGSPKLHRHGNVALSARSYGTLSPDPSAPKGAPSGTLPHLMGVHAYLTVLANEPVIALDLRISNAADGHDKSDPADDALDDLYYLDLELELPAGWTVTTALPDPALGSLYSEAESSVLPIVAPLPTGAHVIPKHYHFTRRFVLAPAGEEARAQSFAKNEGLGFVVPGNSSTHPEDELYSFMNPATGRYLPQRHFIPTLDHVGLDSIRSGHAGALAQYSDLLLQGAALLDSSGKGLYPLLTGNLGPFHVWGVQYGGMTGGVEINPFEAVDVAAAASRDGYRFLELQHRMRSARQSNHLYAKSGESSAYEDWVIDGPNGPYAPVRLFNELDLDECGECDPFGFKNAPMFQVTHAKNSGMAPSYESILKGYDPEDHQHLIRLIRTQVALVWLGNDALAKDDLIATAEIGNMQLLPLPLFYSGTTPKESYGSLWAMLPVAPGEGVFWGRGEWWIQYAMLGAYSVSDDAWRERKRTTFFDTVVDELLVPAIIPCSGYIGVNVNKNTESKYRSRRGNEAAFGDITMLATLRSVYEGVDSTRAQALTKLIQDSSYGSIRDGLSWNSSWNAPYVEMPTAPASGGTPYCTFSQLPAEAQGYASASGANRWEIFIPLGLGAQLSKNPEFLQKADLVLADSVQAPTLLEKLEKEGLDGLELRAGLIACVQRGVCQ